jgi:hypothetical protein
MSIDITVLMRIFNPNYIPEIDGPTTIRLATVAEGILAGIAVWIGLAVMAA